MAAKTIFNLFDMYKLLAPYDIGELRMYSPLADGTVQTNYLVETTTGKYLLKYYESRSYEQVQFEFLLMQHLLLNHFPCAPIIHSSLRTLCVYNEKPYVIYQFIEGVHVEHSNERQQISLIHTIADLARITKSLKLKYAENRLSYNKNSLARLAGETTETKYTINGLKKKEWFLRELSALELPTTLTMGICHCDLSFKNILYSGNKVKALLDFDDANETYLFFDIISIIHFFMPKFDHDTWNQYEKRDQIMDFGDAKKILSLFEQKCPIPLNDKIHFFDILKLGILSDCIWYFDRGSYFDFFERRKIEAINQIGRDAFFKQLFG